MSNVILYSTECSRCTTLKNKLDVKGIPYTINRSREDMKALGMTQSPKLSVDGRLMDFPEAIGWAIQYKS
jgi:glutaredoxin